MKNILNYQIFKNIMCTSRYKMKFIYIKKIKNIFYFFFNFVSISIR